MLTAIAISTKEVVIATGADGKEKFTCPDCSQTVYPRHRAKWTDHFVHKPNAVCKTKLVASLESDEHKLGKKLIIEWLKRTKRKNAFDEIVTEKTITAVDGKCRKIDVAVVKNGKVIEAHECQLSPICIATEKDGLLYRTLDYHRLGISVTWWLGEKADTDTIEGWLYDITEIVERKKWEQIKSPRLTLQGYFVGYPNAVLQKMINNKKEHTQKIEKENMFNSEEIEFVSLGIARFLNLIRQTFPLSKQEILDKRVSDFLECWSFQGLTDKDIQTMLLCITVSEYADSIFTFNDYCSIPNKQDEWYEHNDFLDSNELTREISLSWERLAKEASFELVLKNAPSCFAYFADYYISKNQTIFPPSMLEQPKITEKQEAIIEVSAVSEKEERSDVLEFLFKYCNPKNVQILIKEAIANALDQAPSDATALCMAWEKIQPTLEKPIEYTPLLADEVTKENSLLVNGNGRH